MRELKKLDKVAYIRFASVYRNFEDVDEFSEAIREVKSPRPPRREKVSFSAPSTTAFMARALQLAERGLYTTTPNPRVGCVLVTDGEIVGEGWHEKAGEPHAEVHALHAAGDRARGATAYVTLEPCSHHGRTPPCADALIAAGVARVVAAMQRSQSAGGRAGAGQAAGGRHRHGQRPAGSRGARTEYRFRLAHDARPALAAPEDRRQPGRQDGAATTASASGSPARRRGATAMRWRARACAILTGIGTVRDDDPQLTVRDVETHAPALRVVVDSRLEMPLERQHSARRRGADRRLRSTMPKKRHAAVDRRRSA